MTFLRFIPETTNIDFVKWRYVAFAIDGLLLVVAAGFILIKGFNLGIDFAAGATRRRFNYMKSLFLPPPAMLDFICRHSHLV